MYLYEETHVRCVRSAQKSLFLSIKYAKLWRPRCRGLCHSVSFLFWKFVTGRHRKELICYCTCSSHFFSLAFRWLKELDWKKVPIGHLFTSAGIKNLYFNKPPAFLFDPLWCQHSREDQTLQDGEWEEGPGCNRGRTHSPPSQARNRCHCLRTWKRRDTSNYKKTMYWVSCSMANEETLLIGTTQAKSLVFTWRHSSRVDAVKHWKRQPF